MGPYPARGIVIHLSVLPATRLFQIVSTGVYFWPVPSLCRQ